MPNPVITLRPVEVGVSLMELMLTNYMTRTVQQDLSSLRPYTPLVLGEPFQSYSD